MISYEWHGATEFVAALRDIPANVQHDRAVLQAHVEIACLPIAEAMAAGAPRSARAGYHYAQRFRAMAVRPAWPQQIRVLVGPAGKRAFIGRFLEFGTWRSSPRPHIRPAWDAGRPALVERLKDVVAVELAAVGRRLGFKVKS